VILIAAPFALVLGPLATFIDQAHLWRVSDVALSRLYADIAAAFILALPWGIVMLLLMPHATARFAMSGRPGDLFDFQAAVRSVARDFATWNLAAAAIVTAWALEAWGAERVQLRAEVDNEASPRVAETCTVSRSGLTCRAKPRQRSTSNCT